jgi:myo-inositol-1(or 4)-monophosphatase
MLPAVNPTETSDRALLEVATAAARAACEVLRDSFGSAGLRVHAKGLNDLVSSADHAAERAIVGTIRAQYPDAAFLAEEGGRSGDSGGELEWVIDPLDGTNNYLQGLPIFATSIACRRHGQTVVGVIAEPLTGVVYSARRGGGAFRDGTPLAVSRQGGLDGAFLATGFPFRAHGALDLYLAAFKDVFLRSRGIRRCGAAALDLAWTAAGVFDGFFELRLSPWDLAAGALLVEEAGGVVTDLDGGRRYFDTGNVVAGPEGVWRELRQAVARHADEAAVEAIDGAGVMVT